MYGRPDAPRAWYNELSRTLVEELKYERRFIDPAMVFLRNPEDGVLCGLLVVHVDDFFMNDTPFKPGNKFRVRKLE